MGKEPGARSREYVEMRIKKTFFAIAAMAAAALSAAMPEKVKAKWFEADISPDI